MALARRRVSTLPCGSLASDETRAATNSMAEPFLQVATQAPQPMQAAASMLSSASSRGTGMVLASGTPPVLTDMNPPACMILSNALRSTTRSLMTGKAAERHGSMVIVSPSWNLRMWSWQVVTSVSGPCASPLICSEHMPQIPSRQSWSNATGSLPSCIRLLFKISSISRNDVSSEISFPSYVSNPPFALASA